MTVPSERPNRLYLNDVDDPPNSAFYDETDFSPRSRRSESAEFDYSAALSAALQRKAALTHEGRQAAKSRGEQDMSSTLTQPDSISNTATKRSTSIKRKDSLPLSPSTLVDPATIPLRTSSHRAIGSNGDKTTSPQKSPRKHKSLVSVPEQRKAAPEVDERLWFAQGKPPTHSMNNGVGSASFSQHVEPSTAGIYIPGQGNSVAPETLRGVGADLINGHELGWSAEKENILKGPYEYLESIPGKDVRSQLINSFNAWLAVPAATLRIITGVVTMLHTASLLIDDVEDNSQLRRGVPVAHSIFGTAQTINSANYVYFCALQEVMKLNNPETIKIFTEELLNLHRGQGMDLFWRDTLTCPSEDDYLEMVGNKTGGLFRLAIKLMCAESPTYQYPSPTSSAISGTIPGSRTDYVPLVNTIGLLFQILDDYKNLSDTTYTANKGLCEDLTEGKFSFPIIHAIRSDPANLVLINILKQKTQDDEVKRYAVSYMEKVGSFAYTRRVLRGLTKKALQLVDEVDEGRGKAEGVRSVLERLRVERHSRASQSG